MGTAAELCRVRYTLGDRVGACWRVAVAALQAATDGRDVAPGAALPALRLVAWPPAILVAGL